MKKGFFLKALLMMVLLAPLALLCITPIAASEPMEKDGKYADFVGYQTTKVENGSFSLRAILGVNDTAFNRVGVEILLVTRDEKGKVTTKTYSTREKQVFETVYDDDGTPYEASVDFGYAYAAALTVPNLPETPDNDYLEIVVRPYVLGMNGIRTYGRSAILSYSGQSDDDGYPLLVRKEAGFQKVYASADGFIFNTTAYLEEGFGDSAILQMRNTDETDEYPERAAYFKFHFTPELVKAIDEAASVTLHVGVQNIEQKAGRTLYDAMFHATAADWDESTLCYQTHEDLAFAYELLGYAEVKNKLYMSIDVTKYIREEQLNDDGSLTVSFRVTTEGYSDAALVYLHSRETTQSLKPYIEIVGTIYDQPLDLDQAKNEGYEPWGYAEHLVNEWFDTVRDEVRPLDENGNPVEYIIGDYDTLGYGATKPSGDFTHETPWTQNAWTGTGSMPPSEWNKNRFTRTLATLGQSSANAFLSSEYAAPVTHDVYGGVTNAGFYGNETGFFHVEIIDERPYIIDPLGNPFFAIGMNDVAFSSGTANQEKAILAKYGNVETYYKEITAILKETGINVAQMSDSASLLAVEEGLSVVIALGANTAYMNSLGRGYLSGDGIFPYNNTVCLFDPDYVTFTQNALASSIARGGYRDNPRVFGYTTDNELPSELHMLDNYLTLNPDDTPTNAFSYATAWTWLARRMNDPFPTIEKYRNSPEYEQIRREFLGFWYARYYKTTSEAIKKADPNHMYMGSRANLNALSEEWPVRAAGRYVDMITANLYGGLNPSVDTIVNLYRHSGVPFMVTEFFAKAQDALDANGYPLANSTGAGILVQTQADRAAYYEHYTLALIESRACVGWTWYRMRDNDQSLYRQTSTGKDIWMAYVIYGIHAGPATFMDEDGKIIPKELVGSYEMIYSGDGIASNQNVNKGIFNSTLHSVATVYSYDKNGTLLGSKSYEVEKPDGEELPDGTTLYTRKDGTPLTVGRAANADGSYTETVLTVYEGKYLAFANSIKAISDYAIGLARYFDEN
ncbi:MAG: hypothetical protein E7606_02215 [Ruminococcaceae bacterium]|nr:hypothetical protein [Oscillospiraceae bacterium]